MVHADAGGGQTELETPAALRVLQPLQPLCVGAPQSCVCCLSATDRWAELQNTMQCVNETNTFSESGCL